MEKQELPNSWGDTILKMIFKKGDKADPANYRPIALMKCILKIFMQILTERLGGWLESGAFLPEWQAGFRKNRSCLGNIFSLNALIQSRLSLEKGKLFVLFVDFRGAFPSVSHILLWQKLHHIGTGSKLINVLKNLYKIANVSVKNSRGISREAQVTRGVLQGEVMSPLLFAVFLTDLEQFLKDEGIRGVSINHLVEIILLAYADDIAIPADSSINMKKTLKAIKNIAIKTIFK